MILATAPKYRATSLRHELPNAFSDSSKGDCYRYDCDLVVKTKLLERSASVAPGLLSVKIDGGLRNANHLVS